MVLEEYSNVPFNQVNNVDPKQQIVNFNSTGVEKVEVDQVENEPNIFIERGKQAATTLGGAKKGEYDDRRQGKFTIKEKSDAANGNSNSNEPDLSQYPQTIEKITYKTESTTNGGIKVIEVKDITIKDVVERNGQKYIKTKKELRERLTNYICVPMLEEDFRQTMNHIQVAAMSPYANASRQFKGACLTPEQAKELAALVGEDRLQEFVSSTQVKCADEKQCPWAKQEAPIVQNEPKELVDEDKKVEEPTLNEEVIITQTPDTPKEEPTPPKTAKELKAEMKAAKKREKQARKEAKRKAKEARKAAKKAAKAAKKAEKAGS